MTPPDPEEEDLFPPAVEFEPHPDVEPLLSRHAEQLSTEDILRRLLGDTGDIF